MQVVKEANGKEQRRLPGISQTNLAVVLPKRSRQKDAPLSKVSLTPRGASLSPRGTSESVAAGPADEQRHLQVRSSERLFPLARRRGQHRVDSLHRIPNIGLVSTMAVLGTNSNPAEITLDETSI